MSTCKCCVPEKTVSDGDGTQSRQNSATWTNFQQRWIFRVCLTSMGLIPRSLLYFLRYVHSSLAASQLPSIVSSLSAWFISYVAARPVSECNRFSHGSRWTWNTYFATHRTDGMLRWLMFYCVNTGLLSVYVYLRFTLPFHAHDAKLFYRLMAVAILVTVRPAIDELSRDLLM